MDWTPEQLALKEKIERRAKEIAEQYVHVPVEAKQKARAADEAFEGFRITSAWIIAICITLLVVVMLLAAGAVSYW